MFTSPTKCGWKKGLPKKSLRSEKITTFLLIASLAISFFALFSPQAAATATEITSISPKEGSVGTEVRVNGTIETTNGTYRILFDGEEVKNGTIIGNNVSDTFMVPHRPAGVYNVTLKDLNATSEFHALFTVETAYYVQAVEPAPPNQLQEGNSTQIWVNITGG
ncbi:MAG: IPT/TIG domain-containing protein, partial [Thermoproteota archaeon]|nr:IPT/TIG domain-containing protein [Thermoproteota archaeon]